MPIAYNYARLFILTAKSEASLRATSLNLASWLRTHHPESAAFADLAYTLCSRRSQLTWRRTISAADSLQLEQALSEGFAAVKSVTSPTKSLFTFTGQGAQHYAMGRELLQVSTTFRDSLLASDRMLKGLSASWSIIDELQLGKSDSRINESRIAQPCVTALQIALVDLLHSLGIRPNAVIGHSSGEIAAAYAAGALSQAAALQVAFHRGRISDIHRRTSTSKGAMLAVGLGEAEASKFCLSLETAEVKVACINSPLSTTLSGDEIGISQLQKTFDDNGVFNRKLDVDLAYHSHHMEQPAIEYRGLLDGLAHKMPKLSVQFISSVTGKLKTSGFGPAYWVENLVSQVRFSAALEAYRQMHDNSSGGISQTITHNIIEIGPHSALSTPVLQTVSRSQSKGFMHAYYPSLVKGRDAVRSILDMTGKLFAAGLQVDLTAINALDGSLQERSVLRDLPPYAWDHSNEFWHESRLSIQHRLRPEPHHDLLGDRVVDYAANDRRWRNLVSVDALPWLRDHVVDDFVTFPGSAYVCMALEALKQVIRADRACGKPDEYTFCDVEFLKALIIPDLPNTKVEVNLSLTPCSAGTKRNSTGWEEFRVCSWSEKTGWSQNCHGFIIAHYPSLADGIEVYQERDLQAMSQKKEYSMMNNASKTRIDSTRFYEELEASGNKYGKNFATLKNIRVGDTQAVGNVTIPNPAENMHTEVMQPHTIHPATLDALLHSSFPISSCDNSAGSIMIVSIKEFTISADTNNQPGHLFHVGASVSREDARSSTATILVFEGDQNSELRPVISLSGELRAVGEKRGASQNPQANKAVVYQMKWDRDVDFITGDHCFSTSRASPLEPGEVSPEEKQAILNQAASVYIHDCLRGMTHQKQDISVPHMHLLYKWMERFSTSEEYQQNLESPSRARTSLERLETLGVEGELLQRVGGQIKSLLTGRLDPLACLLEDGLLHRFYAEDESLTRCCAHLVTYLELAIFKNPQMKVLEVGAGTGGTTLSMLKALTKAGSVPFEHYGYTDISSGFFGDAKEKLKDWSEMVTFKTLNIEEDPTQQGFDEGSYDMVIASNVIHATERIRESVGNVRKLLKPGGKLALVEVTRFDAFVNLIFGVLPGWWRGKSIQMSLATAESAEKSCRPRRRPDRFARPICLSME